MPEGDSKGVATPASQAAAFYIVLPLVKPAPLTCPVPRRSRNSNIVVEPLLGRFFWSNVHDEDALSILLNLPLLVPKQLLSSPIGPIYKKE
jgi:hypothetical protein